MVDSHPDVVHTHRMSNEFQCYLEGAELQECSHGLSVEHIAGLDPNTTNVANEAWSETDIHELEREIYAKATEIFGQFRRRYEHELLPMLYRMKMALPHGEWGKWFSAFRQRVRFQWTLRTVQRKFKELENGRNQDQSATEQKDGDGLGQAEEKDVENGEPRRTTEDCPKILISKRLKELHATLSKPSVKNDDMRIEHALRLVEDTQLAIADGLFERGEAQSSSDELQCSCGSRMNFAGEEPISPSLEALSHRLLEAARELRSDWGLDGPAHQIASIAGALGIDRN